MSTAANDLLHGYPADRLVPGDGAALDELAQRLLRFADVFADAAQALTRIDVVWDGPAAAAFRDEFALQPAAFKTAATAFTQAGYALGSQALTVQSAQLMAAQAVALWQDGIAAARNAAAAAGNPLAGAPDYLADVTLLEEPTGMAQRLAAVEKLERARTEVDRSAARATATLREAVAGAPEAVTAWQHLANYVGAPPWELNQERKDMIGGAIVGLLDTGVDTAAGPVPIQLLGWQAVKQQINDVEWQHGVDPNSGWHTTGSIAIPAILGGFAGAESLATRVAVRAEAGLLETAAAKPANPVLLYRAGSARPQNFTPRPGIDTNGLSTFDSLQAGIFKPGEKVQVIDTRQLKNLVATPDGPGGHVSVAPPNLGEVPAWAATRGTDVVHPYTRELVDSLLDPVKAPRK